MEEATTSTEGSMAAMIGGDDDKVNELATACDIDVANFNAPGQTVVSGTREGIEKALASASDYGIRMAKELDVAGAYHSRLMMPAQEKLAAVLTDLQLHTPSIPVTCNFGAHEVSEPAEIRQTLEAQVSGSVRWSECVQHFIGRGETLFIELGPGRVLAGLMRRIDRSVEALSFSDAEGLDSVVDALHAQTA